MSQRKLVVLRADIRRELGNVQRLVAEAEECQLEAFDGFLQTLERQI